MNIGSLFLMRFNVISRILPGNLSQATDFLATSDIPIRNSLILI